LLIYGTLWAVTGNEALPGGNFFGLLVMLVCCLIGGALVAKICLPPLLGKYIPVQRFFQLSWQIIIANFKDFAQRWKQRKLSGNGI
jgi:hypothetical protein